jgi:hypothetical protein
MHLELIRSKRINGSSSPNTCYGSPIMRIVHFSGLVVLIVITTFLTGNVQGQGQGATCGECPWCIAYTQVNVQLMDGPNLLGYTLKGTNNSWAAHAPTNSPYYYLNQPCDDGTSSVQTNPPVALTVWTFSSANNDCDVTSPPAAYFQPINNGLGQTGSGFITQRICSAGS